MLHDQTDPNNPFWATVNRLNLLMSKGHFLASLRYDTEAYFLSDQYFVKYVPEKAFAAIVQALAVVGAVYLLF